jgi:hypothetical protein
MAKKAVKRRVHAPVDHEPKWTLPTPPDRVDIIVALNWYNIERDEKDAAKILKTTPSIASLFMPLAWATRMEERGYTFPTREKATLAMKREEFADLTSYHTKKVSSDEDSSNVISIQDRVKAKSESIIGEMEGLVDDYGIRGDASKLNAYQWMIDNDVKPVHAGRIIEHFRECAKEPLAAISGKDECLKDGYSIYNKARMMNLLQVYAVICKDAERLSANASTARKPRKKKPVSFDKMVAKIKYKIKDDTLKLQSVDPVKVVGAIQLWIFNTKTRKLGVYNAEDAGGLKVKGTTLLNYVEESSVAKTLRKPEKILPSVVDGGKVALRKVMDGIKSKPAKLNGRINKDTLLLRVT